MDLLSWLLAVMACLAEVSDVSTHAWPVEQLHYFVFVLFEPKCPAIGVE